MVTLRHARWAVLLIALLDAKIAFAQAPPPSAPEPSTQVPRALPALHHAPVSVAQAHTPLIIEADIDDPELVARARVVYRRAEDSTFRAVTLRRSGGAAGYVAEIPAGDVVVPSLEYAIEIDLDRGGSIAVFASRREPYRVSVTDDYLDLREHALDTRLGGRRSVVSTSFEYVTFASFPKSDIDDHYFRAEGTYTYRPLRLVTEFGVKGGVLRGVTTAPPMGGETHVGVYYTAATVLFRLVDLCHVSVEGLTGVTETGFELGAGSELLIGDPYGSKLGVGFETINEFGQRFWSRVDIAASRRLIVSPVVEATNWPHADQYGVRLSLGLAYDFGNGFGANVQGGYQARVATSGGPSGGVGLSYAF